MLLAKITLGAIGDNISYQVLVVLTLDNSATISSTLVFKTMEENYSKTQRIKLKIPSALYQLPNPLKYFKIIIYMLMLINRITKTTIQIQMYQIITITLDNKMQFNKNRSLDLQVQFLWNITMMLVVVVLKEVVWSKWVTKLLKELNKFLKGIRF